MQENKIKNLKEAKELVILYNEVLNELSLNGLPTDTEFSEWFKERTGFGDITTCKLCPPCKEQYSIGCDSCIWSLNDEYTILPFRHCTTPNYKKLFKTDSIRIGTNALKARIKRLEKLVIKAEKL